MKKDIKHILQKRILVIDNGLSSQIEKYNISEVEYRTDERLKNAGKPLKGFYDLLSVTKPEVIAEIHEKFLKSGADIIETNTFRANFYHLNQFGLEDISYELNFTAAKIAREKVVKYSNLTLKKPRYLAGVVGPLPEELSTDEMKKFYTEQIKGLLAGKTDLIYLKTQTNLKSIAAATEVLNEIMQKRKKTGFLFISVSETSDKYTPLTAEFLDNLQENNPNIEILAIGENCTIDLQKLPEHLRQYSKLPYYLLAAPYKQNANEDELLETLKQLIDNQLVSIVGACCGNVYKLVKELSKIAEKATPGKKEI